MKILITEIQTKTFFCFLGLTGKHFFHIVCYSIEYLVFLYITICTQLSGTPYIYVTYKHKNLNLLPTIKK